MMNSSFLRALQAAAAAVALSACSGYSPMSLPAGTAAAEVRAQMGAPTDSYARTDGGRRLEYAKGPYGMHTFMVDLDKNERLLRSEQVLTKAHFGAVRAEMARDEVLYLIGHPSETKRLPLQNQQLWAYRFDSMPFCEWFLVNLDSAGRVVETGYGPDPLCTPRE